MKKRIFAVVMAVCLMAGTSAFAQHGAAQQSKEKMSVEQMAQKRADKMADALKLSDKQKKQVYECALTQIKTVKSKHEGMEATQKAAAEKMKSILTPEQYAQWEKMAASRVGGKHSGKGMHGKDGCCKADGKKGGDCKSDAKCDKADGKKGCCKDGKKDNQGKQCKGGCSKHDKK